MSFAFEYRLGIPGSLTLLYTQNTAHVVVRTALEHEDLGPAMLLKLRDMLRLQSTSSRPFAVTRQRTTDGWMCGMNLHGTEAQVQGMVRLVTRLKDGLVERPHAVWWS